MNLVKAIDLYIMQVDNIYCIVSLKMTGGMAGNISVEKTLESSSTVNTTVQMLTGTLPYLLLTVQSMEVLCSLLTDH